MALLLVVIWLAKTFLSNPTREQGDPYLEANTVFDAFEYDPEDRFNFDTKYAWAAVAILVVAAAVEM